MNVNNKSPLAVPSGRKSCGVNTTVLSSLKKHMSSRVRIIGDREHLKTFMDVDYVLANLNKVQDTQANLKTTN